jgi:hypothetical protein
LMQARYNLVIGAHNKHMIGITVFIV